MRKFTEWLKLREMATGTNSIASFARPIGIGTVTRTGAQLITGVTDEKKRKRS